MQRGGCFQCGECFGAGVVDLVSREVEGQGVEHGGCSESGECCGAGGLDPVVVEVEGQGVEFS